MPLGITWGQEEDLRLAELVKVHGPKKWSQIASELKTNKSSKQCRRRWKNYLSLDERKLGSWTPEEDAQLLECHRKHGNKWTLIAQEIGGRTDNAVKNRWAALEKKRKPDGDHPAQQRGSSIHRSSSDLLAVRRIISKDQPQRSFSSMSRQQAALYDADWMQEGMGQAAAAAGQQQDQSYTLQPAGFGGRQPGSEPSSMAMGGKPDLKINIPNATAPELPYSQRPQAGGTDASRLQKGNLTPVELEWLSTGLPGMDQGKPEDDALLSTSRQGAHAAMAGLATPSDQPGWPQDLCSFLLTPGASHFAAAAAAAAAAQAPHSRGPAAPWRDMPMQSMPQTQQQMPPAQMLPASSAPMGYMPHHQQQQMFQSSQMPAQQDAGVMFLNHHQQQQMHMVPPPGLPYGQQQLQQPMHNLSKLSRTVSGFDPAPHTAPMQLPDGMMLRQGLQPPQPRFVPQGPPEASGMSGMGSGLMTHSNAAVTTASGPFQPGPKPNGYQQHQMQRGMGAPPGAMLGHDQQAHMLHRQQQRLPVLSQAQQPPASHLMPQEPMLPQQHMQHMMMRPQCGMAGPGPHGQMLQHQEHPGLAPAPAPPAPQGPASHPWNACDLRQLMELLQQEQDVGQLPQQALPQAPPLCHMGINPVVGELANNNVAGGLATAP